MSDATATTPAPADAAEEVIISDNSKVAEGKKGLVTTFVNKILAAIPLAIEYAGKAAEQYSTVATNRAKVRSVILLADNEPDWTGGSQTYKQFVNSAEAPSFTNVSDSQKRTFDSNVRSHMRRGALDGVIEKWVRETFAMKDLPADSPKLAEQMRRQYARTATQPNPIVCPDKWQDKAPAGDTPGAKTEDTPTAKVNAAGIALTELGGVGAVSHLHAMATKLGSAQTEPNAEIVGGRKLAGDAWLELSNYCEAVSRLLSDANLSGEKLEAAQAVEKKYRHQG